MEKHLDSRDGWETHEDKGTLDRRMSEVKEHATHIPSVVGGQESWGSMDKERGEEVRGVGDPRRDAQPDMC